MQVVLRHGEEALAVSVPDKWKVRVIRNTSRPLTRAEIAGAIDSPIDSPSLEQLARRRSTAAIIVEDHTRPAYVGDIVLEVLDRLNRGGIADDNIVLVGATGAHRSMEYTDFVKKIGPDVVARVRVESHDPFGPCERIGFTSRGTPVELNRTVVSSDLKLAVGSVLPHGAVRFGGGAKLVLPGVASYRTIVHNHNLPNDPVELDGGWQRPHRLDMEEAARMLGLDFYIGFLLDMDVNICRVAAGDMVSAHRWLMERAGEVYGAEMEPLGDVVVACAWPLDLDVFQCGKGLFPAVPFVKLGGTLVWAARCPEGRGCHHLVEKDEAYRGRLVEAFRAAARKARVIFASPGVAEQVARELIPPEIEVTSDTRAALEEAFRRFSRPGLVTVLYSSPMTLGCSRDEGRCV